MLWRTRGVRRPKCKPHCQSSEGRDYRGRASENGPDRRRPLKPALVTAGQVLVRRFVYLEHYEPYRPRDPSAVHASIPRPGWPHIVGHGTRDERGCAEFAELVRYCGDRYAPRRSSRGASSNWSSQTCWAASSEPSSGEKRLAVVPLLLVSAGHASATFRGWSRRPPSGSPTQRSRRCRISVRTRQCSISLSAATGKP